MKTQLTQDKKCEENPRAIRISQVKRVKRVKLHPPQIPLSLSWLGEAKTA